MPDPSDMGGPIEALEGLMELMEFVDGQLGCLGRAPVPPQSAKASMRHCAGPILADLAIDH